MSQHQRPRTTAVGIGHCMSIGAGELALAGADGPAWHARIHTGVGSRTGWAKSASGDRVSGE